MKIKANLIKVLSITSTFLTSYAMEHNTAELNDIQSVANIKENEDFYCGSVTTTGVLAIDADRTAFKDVTLAGSGSLNYTIGNILGSSSLKKELQNFQLVQSVMMVK